MAPVAAMVAAGAVSAACYRDLCQPGLHAGLPVGVGLDSAGGLLCQSGDAVAQQFWDAVSTPRAVAAYKFTSAFRCWQRWPAWCLGLLVAWVLCAMSFR